MGGPATRDRRRYATEPVVVLPPVVVPLDPEHERLALIALADLLAPLFASQLVGDHEAPVPAGPTSGPESP